MLPKDNNLIKEIIPLLYIIIRLLKCNVSNFPKISELKKLYQKNIYIIYIHYSLMFVINVM